MILSLRLFQSEEAERHTPSLSLPSSLHFLPSSRLFCFLFLSFCFLLCFATGFPPPPPVSKGWIPQALWPMRWCRRPYPSLLLLRTPSPTLPRSSSKGLLRNSTTASWPPWSAARWPPTPGTTSKSVRIHLAAWMYVCRIEKFFVSRAAIVVVVLSSHSEEAHNSKWWKLGLCLGEFDKVEVIVLEVKPSIMDTILE